MFILPIYFESGYKKVPHLGGGAKREREITVEVEIKQFVKGTNTERPFTNSCFAMFLMHIYFS